MGSIPSMSAGNAAGTITVLLLAGGFYLTVRVDGADVDASAAGRTDFGMQCRVYGTNGELEGAPPSKWIKAALSRVIAWRTEE